MLDNTCLPNSKLDVTRVIGVTNQMPACPECGKPLSIKRLVFADRTAGFRCEHCGAVLQFNRERTAAIVGFFFLLGIVPAGYDVSNAIMVAWVIGCGACLTVAIVAVGKVESYEL